MDGIPQAGAARAASGADKLCLFPDSPGAECAGEMVATSANTARNFRVGDYERATDDWYVEPRWCVEQLADAIDLAAGEDAVWDPCCGGGTIPTVFRERGFETWATDKVDRGFWAFDGVADAAFPALMCGPPTVARVSIVTNPPFKLAERIARVALALSVRKVCVLQQLSFLASKGRHALFTEFPPSDVLILSRRPSMPPGHMIAEMGDRAFKGGTSDFCWIVWTRPHDRETRMRWLAPQVAA